MGVGVHFIADLYNCGSQILNSVKNLECAIHNIIDCGEFHVLKMESVQFEPQGVTSFAVLSESHLSIHTWPEFNYCSLDIFSCNSHVEFAPIVELLKQIFNPEHMDINIVERGKRFNLEDCPHQHLEVAL